MFSVNIEFIFFFVYFTLFLNIITKIIIIICINNNMHSLCFFPLNKQIIFL